MENTRFLNNNMHIEKSGVRASVLDAQYDPRGHSLYLA